MLANLVVVLEMLENVNKGDLVSNENIYVNRWMICYQEFGCIENMILVEYFDHYDLDRLMMRGYNVDDMLSIDDVEHVQRVSEAMKNNIY
jgi:hypothetical protein